MLPLFLVARKCWPIETFVTLCLYSTLAEYQRENQVMHIYVGPADANQESTQNVRRNVYSPQNQTNSKNWTYWNKWYGNVWVSQKVQFWFASF